MSATGGRLHYTHWRAAVSVLHAIWFETRVADVSLQTWFREHRQMGGRDRAQLTGLVYGVLRDAQSVARLAGPDADAERLLMVYALRHAIVDRDALLRFAPAVLLDAERAIAAHADALSLADAHNVPAPVWSRWLAQYGEQESLALAQALNVEAPVDLRVNTLKTDRESARAALADEQIEAAPTPWSPLGLRLTRRVPLAATRAFREGWIEPQDEGSQLLARLLAARPGERVADFCAGAGGKTLALGAGMDNRGELWALDTGRARLERLLPRAQRAGLSIIHLQTLPDAAWCAASASRFDAVLVDAPCSGTGTWRRNPELRLRPLDLAALAALQLEILSTAATLVRPGGRLVYATCSLLAEENEAVVAAWLATTPAFVRVSPASVDPMLAALTQNDALVLLPHRHHTDGFFAARFERAAIAN